MSHGPFEELKDSGRLAALSPAGSKLHHMKRRGECILEEVQGALQEDNGLGELVLDLAARTCASGQAAASDLGELLARHDVELVRSMGLGFAVALCNRAGVCEHLDYDRFWSTALARASASAELARELCAADPTQAFVAGLLADVGHLALASVYPKEYGGLLTLSPRPDRFELQQLERGLFGLDDHEATLGMLAHYGIPEELIEAVRAAQELEGRTLEAGELLDRDLATCLWAAARISTALGGQPEPAAGLAGPLGLDSDGFHVIGDRIAQEWGEWGDRLRIPTQPVTSFARLVAEDGGLDSSGEAVSEVEHVVVEEKLRILAVDDDPMSLRLLTRYLERGGYEVQTACNGREALDAALYSDPHIVVADWVMPEMDGLELCKALRRYNAGRRIYFLLLTGREEEDRAVEAFEAGVNDFVSKPFRPKRLLARVRASERVIQLWRQHEEDKACLREALREKNALARRLRAAAFTDVLTELPNRRYAIRRLGEEWARSERSGTPLSVIMIDIDFFKEVNDVHGHDVGDTVLRDTARVLYENTRGSESACRLGGEEFLIICSGSDLEQAAQCGERVRVAIEENHVTDGGFADHVTISVGVAQRMLDTVDVDNLLRLADEAVYEAKHAGRNRVIRWEDPQSERRAS